MKKLKVISLLILVTFSSIFVKSQEYHMVQQDDTFYDFLKSWYDSTNYNVNDTGEGGKNSNVERLEKLWLPRLSPSGDASVAAESFINYSLEFQPMASTYSPNWNCLGPSALPVDGQGIGRMHRIEFDPYYNDSSNQVIYASSGFGGLWRTLNNGSTWQNVNTDLQLPSTSVGDIAIDPNSSDTIFITTGLCDEGILSYEANTGSINPVFTSGIYRSDDYGNTWHNISENILDDFQSGGTIRRIIINRMNSSEIFIAGTTGIYKTSNGLSIQVEWNQVFDVKTFIDDQLIGLEFKPNSTYDTIIASGRDIYVSYDAGDNWSSLTGEQTGLDLDNIEDNFKVQRINIAVTPANSSIIYAYIVGSEDYMDGCPKIRDRIYIYKFDFTLNYWIQLVSHTDTPDNRVDGDCNTNDIDDHEKISWDRIAIIASPINEFEYFFGTTRLYGQRSSSGVGPWSLNDNGNGFHVDIHGLAYKPSDPTIIYCAHDGGISVKDLDYSNHFYGWEYLCNGLEIATVWAHDNSEFNKEWILAGLQDDFCVQKKMIYGEYLWKAIGGGDGYSVQNLKYYPEVFNYQCNSSNRLYNYITDDNDIENGHWPIDNLTGYSSFEIKGFKISQHPQKDSIFKGYSQVYKRKYKYINSSNDWVVESDIGKNNDTLHELWSRQIIDFEIAESDPDYCYIVTLGGFNGEGTYPSLLSRLFMSTTGLNNGNWNENHFYEINFPGNGNDPFPVITSLIVHPTNPEKIWITFSGFLEDYKVWSFDGTTWTNEDPLNSLNNLPVNDIVYQPGTADRLYIATDAGVYVKDSTMSTWEKYGDFPNVRVTELKINFCSYKLRAATFGRGLWEGDLLPSYGYNSERVIDEEVSWSDIHALDKNLRITGNGKLTISNTLSMPYMGRIIVERGGELIIDGGKITNNCGQMWQGIQVWGTALASQSTPGAQGKLIVINGGTIENAMTAVRLAKSDGPCYEYGYEGGIIQTDDAHFINNRTGVKFYPYRNMVSGVEMNNLSYFYRSEFLTDTELADESTPEDFIYLNGVKGINIKGCSFTNSRPEVDAAMSERGSGIYSNDASFFVTRFCESIYSCEEPVLSTFANLNYGINARNTTVSRTFEVYYSEFDNNLTGIFFSNIDNADIIYNDFELYNVSLFHEPDDIFGGLYIDNCTGYTIEENNFFNEDEYDPQNEISSIGITVNNSGDDVNMIYRNTFDRLHIGILAQNRNRGTSIGTGLKLKCNTCTNNLGDFAVTADTASANKGISEYQGTNTSQDKTAPAGNLFTHANNNDPYSDFNNTLSRQWINYFHHPGTAQDLWVPAYYHNITPTSIGSYPYIFDSVCPTHFSLGGGLKSSEIVIMNEEELKAMMIMMENLRDSASNELSLWIDAGDTPELNDEVESSTPDESLDIYDELMAYSPYLSDTVLSTSIEKEEVLVDAMIRDIMVANPHGVKKEELMEALEQRVPSLPDYMMAEIMAGLDSIAQKEVRESEISWYAQERELAFNKLVKIYLNDSTQASAEDSLISLILNHGNMNSHYFLASRYFEHKDYSNAIMTLTNLPDQFVMDSEQQSEYQDYLTIYTMVSDIAEQDFPLDSIDSTSRQILYQIAENDSRPAIMAQNILHQIDSVDYPEIYILPTSGPVLRRYIAENPDKNSDPEQGNLFRVYPNPGRDYFIIEYSFETIPTKATYKISDQNGRIIEEGRLEGKQDQLIRRTSGFSSGIYSVNLIIDGKVEKTLKLNIIK